MKTKRMPPLRFPIQASLGILTLCICQAQEDRQSAGQGAPAKTDAVKESPALDEATTQEAREMRQHFDWLTTVGSQVIDPDDAIQRPP